MSRPVFTIIAGSNGCGKSTLTSTARDKFQQTPVLDPDAIAKSLQATPDSNNSNIEAGKRELRLAEELIAKGQTFTVETTLSGATYLKMAERAKASGFNLARTYAGGVWPCGLYALGRAGAGMGGVFAGLEGWTTLLAKQERETVLRYSVATRGEMRGFFASLRMTSVPRLESCPKDRFLRAA